MEWFAGPVLKCNDTEDDRAKVLDSEELMQYLHQRAQAAVDSRDDVEDHQRHVSSYILANLVKPQCTSLSHAYFLGQQSCLCTWESLTSQQVRHKFANWLSTCCQACHLFAANLDSSLLAYDAASLMVFVKLLFFEVACFAAG